MSLSLFPLNSAMNRKKATELPFIIVSGLSEQEVVIDSLKAGAHDFINKNNLARLVPAVKRAVLDAELRRERAHMKKTVFENETMFEMLMDAMSDGVCIIKNHRFINANPSLEKILGVIPGTLIGLQTCDFLEHEEGEVKALRKVELPGCGTGCYELEITRPSGEKRQLRITETAIPCEDDCDERLFVIAHDITERKQMINVIQESEARFRDVALSSYDWVWEVNAEGRYTYCSDKVIDQLGYTAEEMLGKTPFDLMPAAEADRVGKIFQEIAENLKPIRNLENRSLTKDGREIILLTNGVPMLDEEGELLGYRGVDKDITQRKLTEAALEQRTFDLDQRVKELDCLFGISQQLTRIDATQEDVLQGIVEQIPSGWQDPQLITARIRIAEGEFVSSSFKETDQRQVAPLEYNNQVYGEIVVYSLKKESEKPDDLFLQEEQNLLDIIAQRVSVFLERIQMINQVRQSEARTRAITDTARDAIVMLDSNGRVNFWNPGAEQMFGYTAAEIEGKDLHRQLVPETFHPKTFQKTFNRAFPNFRKTGTGPAINNTLELKALCKDGREIPVELSLSSVLIDDEWQAVGVLRDLTERKKAEIKLQQANKMESIGTLAAGIAHEINTPTQFVGNNLRFLQDSFSDITALLSDVNDLIEAGQDNGNSNGETDALVTKVREADLEFLVGEIPSAIEQSQRGIETVSRIVSSMKAFAHPGQDEMIPSDLNKIIQDTITVSRCEWKYDAILETDLTESLPAVPCNPGALGQVILNLITNATHAIKAAKENVASDENRSQAGGAKGLIRITTGQQNQKAVIQVSDSGTGIPKEIQKRIFDPFFTTKDVGKGTGQGLSLVHAVVVENLQGRITFDTEPGTGTTFEISLPLEKNAPEQHS